MRFFPILSFLSFSRITMMMANYIPFNVKLSSKKFADSRQKKDRK